MYFGTVENSPTPVDNTFAVDLGAENHWTVDVDSATGDATIAVTVPQVSARAGS